MMRAANPLVEEEAKKIVDRFVRRFDESYRLLVYHAAIPLILTPELLNYLRHQFLRGQVSWVAEVDLLLSDLFNPVGYELYAMDTAVRAYLLENIEEFFLEQGLDEKHLQEVALVLLGYIKYLARTNSFFRAPELQAQQWAAMVFLEDKKEQVFQEIKEALQNCVSEAELARLTQITQELSPQLSNYPSLIQFAESVRDLLLDLKPDSTETTRQTINQLSQELEIDLSKFSKLGITGGRGIGLNRILLVEDQPEVIRIIRKVLSSQYDIAVSGTDDVNEVIKRAESGQIDLILINQGLPNSRYQGREVNGLEIIQILRANPNISASFPIVGFSQHYRVGANDFLESGADGFYSKQELLEGGDYQKFVDYLQEIFNQVVTQTKSSKGGKNYAISIGINKYDNLLSLKYAVRDAEAMCDWFMKEGGFERIYQFTDNSPPIRDAVSPFSSQPTYAHLMRFLQKRFEKPFLSRGADLWFFFSGHGLRYQGVDYLMLADSDPGDIEYTAISVNYIKELLRRSGAGNVLMFLDASRDVFRK